MILYHKANSMSLRVFDWWVFLSKVLGIAGLCYFNSSAVWANSSAPFYPLSNSGEAQSIHPIGAKFRINFETLSLPEDEKMGIMGGTFLYNINSWFSLGPSAYAAISGQRGGFITLGAAANAQKQIIPHLLADAGFFLGAGGGDGGYTLVGGGLMLRGHAGLYLTSEHWGNLGVGASYVDFPDGHISSAQPYIAYEYPFEFYASPSWLKEFLPQTLSPISQEFSLAYKYYFVPTAVFTNDRLTPQTNLGLLGVQWYRYMTEKLFVAIESEGAMTGESTGYMQILLGGGFRQALTSSTFAKLMAEIGGAGGGGVYTGGGLLLDGGVGLQQYFARSIYLAINADYLRAPSGQFKAISASIQLGYGFEVPDTHADNTSPTMGNYQPDHLRIRTTNQTYFKASDNWRTHHADESVNLLGLQIDYFLQDYFYLTGQGLAAYLGNAGAYMTGLVGPGLSFPISRSPLFINVEGLLGAAGGGGLNVGGGFVWQGNVGIGTQLTDALSLIGYYGYISAPKGEFRANVLGVALSYKFTLFSKPNDKRFIVH